jgi:hypothetical protein
MVIEDACLRDLLLYVFRKDSNRKTDATVIVY